MDFNWNAPLINGLTVSPFFSLDSYEKYSVLPVTVKPGTSKTKKPFKESTVTAVFGDKHLKKGDENCSSTGRSMKDTSPENKVYNRNAALTACLKLKIPFPKPSVFNREEQRLYLDLKNKFSGGNGSAVENAKELNFLNELHKRVLEEQEEFMKYLENVAQHCVDDYEFISPVASKFIEEFIASGRLVVTKYPRFYTMLDTVSLTPTRANQGVCLQHLQTLLELGTVPKVILPKTDLSHKRYKLTMDNCKLSQKSISTSNVDIVLSGKLPMISEDENAERLAVKYGAHIVISSSSLQCLIDNNGPLFQRQWEMPVIIKDHVLTEDSKRHVAYVDKPFIGKNLSNYEKNVLYYRQAMKAALINSTPVSSYSLERNVEFKNKIGVQGSEVSDEETVEKDLFSDACVDLDDLETFGTNSKAHVADIRSRHLSSTSVVKKSNSTCKLVARKILLSQISCAQDASETVSTDDDEDSKLAIDLDSPMSPIMSTDGVFDDKDEIAATTTRQSRRLAIKRQRTSMTSSSDETPVVSKKSLSVRKIRGNRSMVQTDDDSKTLGVDENNMSSITQSVNYNIATSVRQTIDENVDAHVVESVDSNIDNYVHHSAEIILENLNTQSVDANVDNCVEQITADNIDSSVTQAVDADVDNCMEQITADNIESSVTQSVDDNVDNCVKQSTADNIDSSVTQSVDADVDNCMEQITADNIESSVTQSVDDNVDNCVKQSTADNIDSFVTQSIDDHADNYVKQSTADNIDSSVTQSIDDHVDNCVKQSTADDIDSSVTQSIDADVDNCMEQITADNIESSVTQSVDADVDNYVKQSVANNMVDNSLNQPAIGNVNNVDLNDITSRAKCWLPVDVTPPSSTASMSKEADKSGITVKMPSGSPSVKKRRMRIITQRRLSESPPESPVMQGTSLSTNNLAPKYFPSVSADVTPTVVSTSAQLMSTSSLELVGSLSLSDPAHLKIHSRSKLVDLKANNNPASAKSFTVTEPVDVMKRKRGRPPKLQATQKQVLTTQKTSAVILAAATVNFAVAPALCKELATSNSPTVPHPAAVDSNSVGRRRIARTPLHNQTHHTSTKPSAHTVSDSQHTVTNSQQTSTVDDAQLRSVGNSTRKTQIPPSKTPVVKSSFQSPLDQILVDQSRMFVQTSVNKVPTPHLPANVQFCPQSIAMDSLQDKLVLPTPSTTGIGTSSRGSAVSFSSGPTVQGSSTSLSGSDSLQSSSVISSVTPSNTTSASSISSSSATSASVSETLVPDHDKLSSCENPQDYRRPPKGNVVYDLWKLGNLKVLIRNTYHGVYNKPKQTEAYFVHLLSKLEYQLQHGIEQLSYGDAVRSWLALHLRRNVRLIRARIDPLQSEIALIEEWDVQKFQKELPTFHPGPAVTVLHSVLERLVKLDQGCHLLSHMPGSVHAQIKKTTKSQSGVYDLHLAYHGSAEPTKSANVPFVLPWLPINTNHLLPYHLKFCRIPCTFEPKDTALINTARVNVRIDSRKPNKKKKKNKPPNST